MGFAAKKTVPMCLPQFSHIKRYKRADVNVEAVAKIMPGEYYVSVQNEMISTVLGSCISVCVYDGVAGVGGMNHFMLPADADTSTCNSTQVNQNTRYGNYAMEMLVNDILLNGGRRNKLRFKVFGGGNVMSGLSNVGERNVAFIRSFIANERYIIDAEDLGDDFPREVHFFPMTGKVRVKRLPRNACQEIVKQEIAIAKPVVEPVSDSGDLELF